MNEREPVWDPPDWRKNVIAGRDPFPDGGRVVEDGVFAYCDKLTKIMFLDDEIDPGPESAYEGCSDKLERNW